MDPNRQVALPRVSIPQECHLWKKGELDRDDVNSSLVLLKTFEDDSHLIRNLLRCKECGHLFFHEFYEIVDWEHGNDAQYSSWIPVDDAESAETLNRVSPLELLKYTGIRVDYPSSAERPSAPHWNVSKPDE